MRYLTGTRDSMLLRLIYELSKQKDQHGSELPQLDLEEIAEAINTIPETFYLDLDGESVNADFIRPDIEALTQRAFIVLSKNRVQLTPFGSHIASTFRLPIAVTEALKTLQ